MKAPLFTCAALALATACASTDGSGDTSKPRGGDAKVATVAISSVQMIEDCPDLDRPAPDTPPVPAAAKAARRMVPAAEAVAAGDVAEGAADDGSFDQPCTQSTMQLSFIGQGPSPAKVEIQAVRILSPTGKILATIKARGATWWTQSSYQPWDEQLAPDSDLKASYKLSVPDWSELDKKVGGNSYGKMFVLEVDVLVGGQKQTAHSSQFPREEPHVIVT